MEPLSVISQGYRNFQRYQEIINVFLKHGFEDAWGRMKSDHRVKAVLAKVTSNATPQGRPVPLPRRLRLAFEELGPTFVKMGQILSTRPDLIPAEFVEEFARLQSRVPPIKYSEVKQVVQTELGGKLSDLFSEFERKPVGSASLGQVHRAVLPTGEAVAVKVQRPGVQETVQADLAILRHLAALLEKHLTELQDYQPTRMVEAFAQALERELDYTWEASHLRSFSEIFQDDESVCTVVVYPEFSTAKVLTMAFMEGISAENLDALDAAGLDRVLVARRGIESVAAQIFSHGFFHADPHPGNIQILPDNVVCFLDLGMVGRLNRHDRLLAADLVLAMGQRDETATVKYLLKLCNSDDEPDRRALEERMAALIGRYVGQSLQEVSLATIGYETMNVLREEHLYLPPNFSLMFKAIASMEGLGRSLDPTVDVMQIIAPVVARARLARYNPKHLSSNLMDSVDRFLQVAQDLPDDMGELIRLVKRGKLRSEISHELTPATRSTLNRLTDRLVSAIIIAALLVGSSIMVLSDIPPKWHDIPVMGLLGFMIAALLGVFTMISVWRHRDR